MIPSQTLQVLVGMVTALLYGGAVAAIGVLSLSILLGRQASAAVRARVGWFGFLWLGFVLAQGILGIVWLVLSLTGTFYPWLTGFVVTSGLLLGCALLFVHRREILESIRFLWFELFSLSYSRSWYSWLGMGLVTIVLLRGLIALLPPDIDDAVNAYLVSPKIIAESHTLELQPFVRSHNGLLPMQVDLHWAALFAISNETAVTVWDYLCALSFLAGIGFLAWSLTGSRAVAIFAILMMLTTPAFYELMGGGRPDNASAQYGIAAFLWAVLFPVSGLSTAILAGLSTGWAMAARYTNFILLPALIVFALIVHRRSAFALESDGQPAKISWVSSAVVCGIAAALAAAPMLIKNWLFVGCPLAPIFGCEANFWANSVDRQNISVADLPFYPFVWTFGHRDDMLGNISPLFLGVFPFLLGYRRYSIVRLSLSAGFVGLISLATYILVKPLLLYTRWLLVPLGLLAIPLSASLVAVERDRGHDRKVRGLVRGGISIIVLFLLFQSRGVVHAVRYLAAIDSRAARYESMPYFGYDVAAWLNAYVQPGQRVALGGWSGYPYFIDSRHLLNSESAAELQWLWERYRRLSPPSSTADLWDFYTTNGFSYAVLVKDRVPSDASVQPDTGKAQFRVAFTGQKDAVLKIEKD